MWSRDGGELNRSDPHNQECTESGETKTQHQKQTTTREREDYAYLARLESFGNMFGRV